MRRGGPAIQAGRTRPPVGLDQRPPPPTERGTFFVGNDARFGRDSRQERAGRSADLRRRSRLLGSSCGLFVEHGIHRSRIRPVPDLTMALDDDALSVREAVQRYWHITAELAELPEGSLSRAWLLTSDAPPLVAKLARNDRDHFELGLHLSEYVN